MRRRAILLGVAASALVVSHASATAPGDQYARYNRDDLIIHDNFTRLDWQRKPTSGVVTFANAAPYCATLVVPNDSGGPWRLPTYKELLTLVDEQIENDGTGIPRAIDLNAFPDELSQMDAQPGPYWSSSISVASGKVLCVDFSSGASIELPPSVATYVRCVRPTP